MNDVGLFSRGKSKAGAPDGDVRGDLEGAGADGVEGTDGVEGMDGTDGSADAAGVAGGTSARPSGPLDRSEVDDDTDYLNLGAIWLRGTQGMELRLEINEQEQQITGVTAVLGESAVQLQAFAAPRTEGVWIDIRNEIAASIVSSGGTAEVVTGEFGEELLTRMPQAGADGRTVFVPARFVGVDGPRWFLRAVVSGRAAIEPDASSAVYDVVRTAVIDRGDDAMPPRELLPLHLPEVPADAGAAQDGVPQDGSGETGERVPPRLDDLNPFERGPEITEVR
ncbi:MAG: hypothetical protein JWP82_250 [Humibacillus sp.]|nr:hypothetical protein [Humibacillus sp.]